MEVCQQKKWLDKKQDRPWEGGGGSCREQPQIWVFKDGLDTYNIDYGIPGRERDHQDLIRFFFRLRVDWKWYGLRP
jgi:hypothetical protein